MSVRPGLSKSNPTNAAEWLRQPVFTNPLITNTEHRPLGLSGKSEGNTFANAACTRVKDFWDQESQDWKSLSTLGVSFHPVNWQNKELIINSIPWNPTASDNRLLVGDWVSKREKHRSTFPNWVYQIMETSQSSTSTREYRKTSPVGRIQPSNSQNVIIPLAGYEPVRVLVQEHHGATLRLAKDLPTPGKKPRIYWIFETSFISNLQWDPRNWHWQEAHNMGDAPFFGYSAKRGY
jgi:hypothetical protein